MCFIAKKYIKKRLFANIHISLCIEKGGREGGQNRGALYRSPIDTLVLQMTLILLNGYLNYGMIRGESIAINSVLRCVVMYYLTGGLNCM